MPELSTDPKTLSADTLKRKRVFQRSLVILSVLSLVLLIVIQRKLLNLGPGLSSNQGVITLVSINLSVLVLGLLLFLILRGLYKIYFERRSYGSLQTKMVVSFISLSLVPTLLIFYFSHLLIGQDHDTWFSSSIRDTFEDALALSEYAQELDRRLLSRNAEDLALKLEAYLSSGPSSPEAIAAWLAQTKQSIGIPTAELYSLGGLLIARAGGPEKDGQNQAPSDQAPTGQAASGNPASDQAPTSLAAAVDATSGNADFGDAPSDQIRLDPDLVESLASESRASPIETGRLLVPWPGSEGRPAGQAARIVSGGSAIGWLALGGQGKEAIEGKAAEISQGLAKYRVALEISRPFRVAQMTSLAGVTLLGVFLSVWIGSHLADSLASPITELVEGTRRVAKGDLDFSLAAARNSGEMAYLVDAFNQMTRDLKESYSELDRRRRFLEAILRQVSSGVLIFDLDSNLINLNQAARDLLALEDFAPPAPRPPVIDELLAAEARRSKPAGHAFVEVGEETLSLTVRRAPLNNEEGKAMGFLITFDDLSELEKAQRLAAWR